MDPFAAMALLTDLPDPVVLYRKPDRRNAHLFNVEMRKQILGQSLYQTFIILLLLFAADKIFSYDKTGQSDQQINAWHAEVNTLIFNAFVIAQIFNSINSRRIDNKKNVFDGILKNPWFMGITLLQISIQVLIVLVGGAAFGVHKVSDCAWIRLFATRILD
ncbi:hypothetical protein FRC03_002875 [Tulasnella sp. 419]|nr:hypothetical protein FRC03_002875 [Tulasnella sp. 419]